ncbi:uncharacterized protein BO95DRAFT_479211 [Aspergillus brunneoviolaceus CBS 621.78]|uniref:Uncharacterized protein n=1 Tax=Aspergillus brunneoviolaceus CBS 621.78 TaxID=1450534 RepID=A0ACD1GLD8_9EURO|nr:hypothetical protein BO95DRAFT_479211 [Aspergillus brunneoviolaceus CBS 621.78]RAH49953.1 hypothetical protein BO95DRAFT_479211 [Aspergillus brunneoviolaceus CBS 621.78]
MTKVVSAPTKSHLHLPTLFSFYTSSICFTQPLCSPVLFKFKLSLPIIMGASTEMCPLLFRLPVELRLQIYALSLNRAVPPHSLLRVCRQVRAEALSVVLRKRRFFERLDHLVTWVQQSPAHLLPLVRSIHVNCIVGSALFAAPAPKQPTLWQEMYQSIVSTASTRVPSPVGPLPASVVAEALAALSGVRDFGIFVMQNVARLSSPQFLADQRLLLTTLGTRMPQIQKLELDIDFVPLDFLRWFAAELHHLTISGYAAAADNNNDDDDKATDTIAIFRALRHLQSLTLLNEMNTLLARVVDKDVSRLAPLVAVTPEVVQEMHPLQGFAITSLHDRQFESHFLTAAMIRALLHTHADTLLKLEIWSDGQVTDEVAVELTKLLPRLAQLRTLRLHFRYSQALGLDLQEFVLPTIETVDLQCEKC